MKDGCNKNPRKNTDRLGSTKSGHPTKALGRGGTYQLMVELDPSE